MSIADRIKSRIALTALTLLAIVGLSPKQLALERMTGGNKYVPHQGEREMARRRRQIESGMLRAENGVDLVGR